MWCGSGVSGEGQPSFAKTIPANYAVAVVHLLSLRDGSDLHEEAVSTFTSMRKTLLKRAEKAAQANNDALELKLRGQDLRKIVTQLDFLCSFDHHAGSAKGKIIEIIRSLGYVGLAGVIAGEASTSPAKLYFRNGRVYLEGLGNTSGWRTMKRIPGIITPKGRGDRTPYSVPAAQFEPFKVAVMAHWPLFDANLVALKQECADFLASCPVEVAAVAAVRTAPVFAASFLVRSQDFTLAFPWRRDRNMMAFLGELKTLPASDRSYDPASKIWSFKLVHEAAVKAICLKYYDAVNVLATGVLTPEGAYVKKSFPHLAKRAVQTWPSYYRR